MRSQGVLVLFYIICLFRLWSPKEDRWHAMSPLSLSSFKINKDVKHQSSSWLIKEDLKYFPLCLTWFWVSPCRTTTTGRNTVTRFFVLLLSVCVAEIEQTKPRLALLWCQWVWLFKGCLFWALTSLGQTEPERSLYTYTHEHKCCWMLLYFTVQATLLIATLKEQQPAIGSLSFEVNCVLWPTMPVTSALDG